MSSLFPDVKLPRLIGAGAACLIALLWAHVALAAEVASDAEPRIIQVVTAEELAAKVAATKGRPAVINFWATWCPPCIKEMPEFVRFVGEFPGDDVQFVSVSVDHPDTIDRRVRPYVEKEALPFPVWVFSGMPDDVGKHLPFELHGAVPVTVVLDADGQVVRRWEEEITYADLDAAVRPLLAPSE